MKRFVRALAIAHGCVAAATVLLSQVLDADNRETAPGAWLGLLLIYFVGVFVPVVLVSAGARAIAMVLLRGDARVDWGARLGVAAGGLLLVAIFALSGARAGPMSAAVIAVILTFVLVERGRANSA